MKTLTVRQAEEGSGGTLISGSRETEIREVVRDSREASEGTLFAALIGEARDGHDFLESAYMNGCRVFLVHDEKKASVLPDDAAVILTDDSLKGIQKLAVYYIKMFDIIKIGVTGSTGKTSTKDLLYAVLSKKYKTIRNQGNFNNHLGVPLTAFLIDDDTQAAIFEMGMNNLGEIDVLADIVRPDAALITNIGISHIGNLGSRENILKAKLEITGYMNKNNVLIYNADNDMMKNITELNLTCGLVSVGSDSSCSAVISDVIDRGENGIMFSLETDGVKTVYDLDAPGVHNAWNSSLAIACAHHFGVTFEEAREGLRSYVQEGKRLNIIEAGDIRIIDDTYNASPDSVKAALNVLRGTKGTRRIAVLADMFELGENSAAYHSETGRYAAETGTDILISVGHDAKNITGGAEGLIPNECLMHFEDRELLEEKLLPMLMPGDVILLKGSRAMKMDETVQIIKEKMKRDGGAEWRSIHN